MLLKNGKFILKHSVYSQCHADAWYPHYVIVPRPTTVGRSLIPWIAWPRNLCPAYWSASTAGVCDVISHDSWSSGSFAHIPPKCVWYHVVILCMHKWSAFSVRNSDTWQLNERVFYWRGSTSQSKYPKLCLHKINMHIIRTNSGDRVKNQLCSNTPEVAQKGHKMLGYRGRNLMSHEQFST